MTPSAEYPYRSRFPEALSIAWLDDDGRHVWFRHHCALACDCPEHVLNVMLPWPRWKAEGTTVQPSITCTGCGFHEIVTLIEISS